MIIHNASTSKREPC